MNLATLDSLTLPASSQMNPLALNSGVVSILALLRLALAAVAEPEVEVEETGLIKFLLLPPTPVPVPLPTPVPILFGLVGLSFELIEAGFEIGRALALAAKPVEDMRVVSLFAGGIPTLVFESIDLILEEVPVVEEARVRPALAFLNSLETLLALEVKDEVVVEGSGLRFSEEAVAVEVEDLEDG